MKTKEELIKPYQLFEIIKQELHFPIHLYNQLIKTLKNNSQLRRKYGQSSRMNQFKDQMFQKIVSMFQQKQSKVLNKLKNLQEINLKYIQRYLQAKKKPHSVLDQSQSPQRRSRKDDKNADQSMISSRKSQLTQSRLIRQDIKEITLSIQSIQNQSIFQSKEWEELIENAELQISTIEQENNQENIDQKDCHKLGFQSNPILIVNSFITCLNSLLYRTDEQGKSLNQFTRKLSKLAQQKKQQISDNTDLKLHLKFNNDLKRLKDLLQRSFKFQKSIDQLKQSLKKDEINLNSFIKMFQIITEKVELQNLILAETNSNEESIFQENELQNRNFPKDQNENDLFNKVCQQLLTIIQSNQNADISKKMVQNLSLKKKILQQSLTSKVRSLSDNVQKVQEQSKRDRQLANKLTKQNEKIKQQMRELQNLRQKYLYFLETKDLSQFSIRESSINQSRTGQRIQKLMDRQEEQYKLVSIITTEKDQALKLQRQQNKRLKQKIGKIEQKMRTYLNQQGVEVQTEKNKQDSLQKLFNVYSQTISNNQSNQGQKGNQQKKKDSIEKDQDREDMLIKLMQDKYSKALQLQREQLEQRMQQLKSQLRFAQLQRDSYKNSVSQLQKQVTKAKQFNQRLVNKKNELEMQSCKTEQMLKSILQLLFGYLMGNISYESLVEQLQHTVQNIKYCIKYREREKDKEMKQQPIIDYRFSGLSAVSNDYSFSKLNKESYCDYFNQDSSGQEQSEVLSKISEEDQLPPSRPSFSNNPKRTLNDINQRATMAHQDQSLLGYLNPVQVRTPRGQYQRSNVLFQGINDDHIRSLQSNLGYLRNRISQQTIQVEKQTDPDAQEIYIKYKQALKALQESERINKDNQIRYQKFLNQLKQQGALQNNQNVQRRLYFMQRTIQDQQRMLQQQKVQYETTITQRVIESQKNMQKMLKMVYREQISQSSKRINK